MMKVSDPIMFGHMVKVYYKDVFAKHGDLFKQLGVNVNNGLGDIYDKIRGHAKQTEVCKVNSISKIYFSNFLCRLRLISSTATTPDQDWPWWTPAKVRKCILSQS